MKRLYCVLPAVLLVAPVAVTQPIPPNQKIGLTEYLQRSYRGLKANLTQAAEKMPGADYGFRPGGAAEVRTYGQLFAHVATAQFGTCAAIKGVPDPSQGKNLEQELEDKARLTKALADSFTLCDEVLASLTEANGMDFIRQGPGEVMKSAILAGLLAHGSEMYGVATVYLREKNLIPPSTERQRQGRGRGR